MQKHLPEVFDFIRETGDFDPPESSDETSDDPNTTEPEDEPSQRTRVFAASSPPESRPLRGASTAQSSAALRGVISPSGAGALSPRVGNVPHSSVSPSAFQSLSPGRSTQPSRSPAMATIQSPPGRDSAQPATEALRHFGLGPGALQGP